MQEESPLKLRFQHQDSSRWFGLLEIRIWTNCVENCFECASPSSCSNCFVGFEKIVLESGEVICTEVGTPCQTYSPHCLVCALHS